MGAEIVVSEFAFGETDLEDLTKGTMAAAVNRERGILTSVIDVECPIFPTKGDGEESLFDWLVRVMIDAGEGRDGFESYVDVHNCTFHC